MAEDAQLQRSHVASGTSRPPAALQAAAYVLCAVSVLMAYQSAYLLGCRLAQLHRQLLRCKAVCWPLMSWSCCRADLHPSRGVAGSASACSKPCCPQLRVCLLAHCQARCWQPMIPSVHLQNCTWHVSLCICSVMEQKALPGRMLCLPAAALQVPHVHGRAHLSPVPYQAADMSASWGRVTCTAAACGAAQALIKWP